VHLGLTQEGNFRLNKLKYSASNFIDFIGDMDDINQREIGISGLELSEYMSGQASYEVLLNYNDKLSNSSTFKFYIGHHGTANSMLSDCIMPVCAYGEYRASYMNIFGKIQDSNKITYVGGMIKDYHWVMKNLFGDLKVMAPTKPLLDNSMNMFNKSCLVNTIVKSNVYNFHMTNIISRYSLNMARAYSKNLNW